MVFAFVHRHDLVDLAFRLMHNSDDFFCDAEWITSVVDMEWFHLYVKCEHVEDEMLYHAAGDKMFAFHPREH